MRKCFQNTETHCVQNKMGILYQVRGDEYTQVLQACEGNYSEAGHTYVGMVTTREPIQRTLSSIHQQCNTGFREKDPSYQAFCRNDCTYDRSSEAFWQRFLDETNNAYITMNAYLNAQKAAKSPMLVIDSSMVNDLFQKVNVGLRERGKEETAYKGWNEKHGRFVCLQLWNDVPNVQTSSTCQFDLFSSLEWIRGGWRRY
jgi:hypothetical protein